MKKREFDKIRFGAGMQIIFNGEKYNLWMVDLEERLFCIDEHRDGETQCWKRCENISIIDPFFVKAHYRSIPCLFNERTNEIRGRNWFFDKLIDVNVWIDFEILGLEELPVYIECDEEELF